MGLFDTIKGKIANKNTDDFVGAYDNEYMDEDGNFIDADEQLDATSISSSALQLKVVKPESFDDVTAIATHLLEGKTVVLNLENTNKESARRLIDFLSGVVFSIQGHFKNVAVNTFIITPHDVDVSGDQLASSGYTAEADEE